jgi:hypothetical protein
MSSKTTAVSCPRPPMAHNELDRTCNLLQRMVQEYPAQLLRGIRRLSDAWQGPGVVEDDRRALCADLDDAAYHLDAAVKTAESGSVHTPPRQEIARMSMTATDLTQCVRDLALSADVLLALLQDDAVRRTLAKEPKAWVVACGNDAARKMRGACLIMDQVQQLVAAIAQQLVGGSGRLAVVDLTQQSPADGDVAARSPSRGVPGARQARSAEEGRAKKRALPRAPVDAAGIVRLDHEDDDVMAEDPFARQAARARLRAVAMRRPVDDVIVIDTDAESGGPDPVKLAARAAARATARAAARARAQARARDNSEGPDVVLDSDDGAGAVHVPAARRTGAGADVARPQSSAAGVDDGDEDEIADEEAAADDDDDDDATA